MRYHLIDNLIMKRVSVTLYVIDNSYADTDSRCLSEPSMFRQIFV